MTVGILELQLRLDGCFSLKDKRQIVRSLIDRCRRQFKVAIAEVEDLELWNVATIGVSCVSNDPHHAESVLQHVVSFVETWAGVEIESGLKRFE